MNGEDRRKEIIRILEKSEKPVSGLMLSKKCRSADRSSFRTWHCFVQMVIPSILRIAVIS